MIWYLCRFFYAGAVDEKHVQIQAPKLSGSSFFNYKRTFSTILMAVCDDDYRFTYIDVGSCGKEHDSSVFAQSEFGKRLADGSLNLPSLPADLPFVFVGDEAFPLRPNMMRPFLGANPDETRQIFNYRLSRARRVIENTFGILVTKWRIFRQPIVTKPETVDLIVNAACVLHIFFCADAMECRMAGSISPRATWTSMSTVR